jgi:polyferredoxin
MQFYLWVRYFERGGECLYVPRPAEVEGWLPIAGLMNSKYFLLTGKVPTIHPTAMFLFAAFLLMSLLVKKAFCSWLCPVGTVSEYL